MNIKNLFWVTLAAGLLAGCATEKSEQSKQGRPAVPAKIARAGAQQIALQQASNGNVTDVEIEKEHGELIGSFDIAVPDSPNRTEVAVDAVTGQVVSVETETSEQETGEKN